MTERLPSDHDTVTSYRVHVERVGRTRRVRVPLSEDLPLEPGDVIHLSLEGTSVYGQVDETLDGRTVIDRASDNRRLARTTEGEDRLHEWASEAGLSVGDPVFVDVVTEGYAYGVRRPGDRIVYDAPDAPSETLSRIAEDLE